MLASGSKSDKLSVAFRAFDADRDDRLSRKQLEAFFGSFLSWIVSLAKTHRSAPVSSVAAIVKATAASVVSRVISSEFVRGEETVSFVEFGQWYNASGHVFVPWIELLDVNKWPDVLSDGLDASYGEDTSDEDYVPGEDEDEDDDDDDDEDDEEEEEEEDDNGADDEEEEGEEEEDDSAPEGLDDVSDPPVFLFALPPSSSTAKLSRADMSGAIDVLNTCGINGQKVSDVATALTPLLGTGVVASSRFDDAVSSLLSVSKFGDAEADKITSFFSRVYFAVSSV